MKELKEHVIVGLIYIGLMGGMEWLHQTKVAEAARKQKVAERALIDEMTRKPRINKQCKEDYTWLALTTNKP